MAERAVHGDQPQVRAEVVRSGDGVDDDVERVARGGQLIGIGGHDEPLSAEPAGVAGLAGRAADDRGRGAECHGHPDREMPEAAQPRHGDPAAGAHAQGAQGLPDGDAGAEERSRGGRVEAGRKRVREAFADDVLAGEAAQRGGSVLPVGAAVGEGREGAAEVLLARPAHGALAARIDDVADRDGAAGGEAGDRRAGLGHHAGELVARHQGVAGGAVVVADRVQVAVADAAVVDPDREVVGAQVAPFQLGAPQRRRAVQLPSGRRTHNGSP